jgi:hypothetical protein
LSESIDCPNQETIDMSEWSPLEGDVLLKGTLRVIVRGRRDRRPRAGQRLLVKGCGFI